MFSYTRLSVIRSLLQLVSPANHFALQISVNLDASLSRVRTSTMFAALSSSTVPMSPRVNDESNNKRKSTEGLENAPAPKVRTLDSYWQDAAKKTVAPPAPAESKMMLAPADAVRYT